MKKFGLQFNNQKEEVEFYKYNEQLHQMVLVSYVILESAICLYYLSINWRPSYPVAISVLIGGVISIFVFKMSKYIFNILLLLTTSVFCNWYLESREIEFRSMSPQGIFLTGWTFGLAQCFFIQGFCRIELICLAEISVVVGKIMFLNGASLETNILHGACDAIFILLRIVQEIKKRKMYKVAKDYHQSLQKFVDLIENKIPTGLVIINESLDKILFTNSTFKETFKEYTNDKEPCNLLGDIKIDPEVFEGDSTDFKDMGQILTDDDLLASTICGHPVHCHMELKTRGTVYVEVRMFPFKWDRKNVVAILLNDVSKQWEISRLKIQNENKEMAISTVAHELRNPMNAILGSTLLMEEKTKDPAMLHSISILRSNINYLLSLLNSILDIQQINSNKLKLNISAVDIEELCQTVVRLFEFQTGQKKIFFNYEIMPETPSVIFTDRERLTQVLINLSANALKFTFEGGITLYVSHEMNEKYHVKFAVTDSGIGIKEKDLGNLFKAFGKLESSSSINKTGVGLGLMISNSLVRILNHNEQDGKILVSSTAGKGSTFYFYMPFNYYIEGNDASSVDSIIIPIERVEYPEASPRITSVRNHVRKQIRTVKVSEPIHRNPSLSNKNLISTLLETAELKKINSQLCLSQEDLLASAKRSQANLTKKSALAVDDNTFNVLIFKKMLEDLGFNVLTGYTGVDALKQYDRHINDPNCDICIIFMDCEMPVMDGFEATKKLIMKMNKNDGRKIPIIGTSGHNEVSVVNQAKKIGMADFLTKPITKDKIADIIKKHKCCDT